MKFMGSLLAGGNKKAKANQNIRGEWDFCLKRLSAPTKTLPLLFEAHTLTLNIISGKNNEHSIHLPPF